MKRYFPSFKFKDPLNSTHIGSGLLASPAPEHPSPSDPGSQHPSLSQPGGEREPRPQTLPCPPPPRQSPSQPFGCGDTVQIVTSLRTKASWSSQCPSGAGPGLADDRPKNHICATDWQPRVARSHRLLIHTLAGKEETVTPRRGLRASFARAVSGGSAQCCVLKRNRKYYPRALRGNVSLRLLG